MGTPTRKVELVIDGKNDYNKDYNFTGIVLTQELLRPNELSFTMQKKGLTEDAIADNTFALASKLMGAKVELKIEATRFNLQNEKFLTFKGIISHVEVRHRRDMFTEQLVDVRACSPDFLLIDHPHCFSYEEMALDSIVNKTIEPYKGKMPNVVKPRTKGAIPYTVQYNESNYQFLTRLAQRYGEWMYNDGEQWIFGEVKRKKQVVLDPRFDILDYRFQSDLMHHKVKHAHHDYLKYENPSKKDSDFSDLMSTKYQMLTDVAKEKSASLFTKETFQHLRCSNPEDNKIDEPTVSVKTLLFGEKMCQTVCTGSTLIADLTIGSEIKIVDRYYDSNKLEIDARHNDLIITGITHTTEMDGKYTNYFTAHPAKSEFPPYYQSDLFPFASAQRAKVMENIDPEKLGRIRVQFLWQEEQDPNLMTPWIRIAHPYAGHEKGFCFIPEIEEEVMVDFENGNAEKPYVVGALYHSKQTPEEAWVANDNFAKTIRSRSGQTIQFVDYDKRNGKHEGCICIWDEPREHYDILFDSELKLIRLKSKGNIELFADGDITMEAGGNMNIKVGKDKKVDVEGDMTVKVTGDKSVKAKNIKLTADVNFDQKAGSAMKISSATHEQKSSAKMKLDGGGMLEAKAGLVKIN